MVELVLNFLDVVVTQALHVRLLFAGAGALFLLSRDISALVLSAESLLATVDASRFFNLFIAITIIMGDGVDDRGGNLSILVLFV